MASGRFSLQVDGTPVSGDVLARLTTLELRQGDDAIGLLRLRFALAQVGDGTYPLLDESVFEPGSAVSLSLAAPGGTDQKMFFGYLAYLRPHFETIEANSYLDIVCHDPAILLDAEERVASYPDKSDADVVTEIMARYTIDVQAEPTDAVAAEDENLLMQRGTDWQFIQQLAGRNGYVVYFGTDANSGDPFLYFGPPRTDADPQADVTILRENSNLLWIDFEVAHNRPAQRRASAIDPLAKRIIRADAEADSQVLGESLHTEAAEQGLKRGGAEAAVRLLRSVPVGDTALNALARGVMANDHNVIQARGEIDPNLYRNLLQPHQPVLIKGVGDRLGGIYYIDQLRTTLTAGELAQTFSALSNAFGRTGLEEFGQSAEEEPAA